MKFFKLSASSLSLLLYSLLISYIFINGTYKSNSTEKSKSELKLYPYEWLYLKKTWPYMNADPRAYLDALEQAINLHKETAAERLNKGLNTTAWEFVGPINIGGRVVDIEFNPLDPSIVYAGFATGGVFK